MLAAAGGHWGPRTKRQRSVGAERPAEPKDRMPPQRHRSRCSPQRTPKRAFSPKSRTGSQAGRRGPCRAEFAQLRPAVEQTTRDSQALLLQGRSKGADVNSEFGNLRLGGAGATTAVRSARSARTLAPPGAQSRILSCVPQYTIRAGIWRISLDRDAVQVV